MEFKILLIGTTEVGKTSILSRYTGNSFQEKLASTVGIDFQVKIVTWNDEDVKLQIWDTAGQERYRSITTAYYRGANGFLLVFSLTKRESFTSLNDWIKQVKDSSSEDVPFILVGNKSDLNDKQVVSTEEAQKYADSIGQEYFETSSKDNVNINEAFEALLTKIFKGEDQHKKTEESVESEPIPPKATVTNENGDKADGEVHDDASKKQDEEKEEKLTEGGKKVVEGDAQDKSDAKKDPIRLEKEEKCEHAHHQHSFCSC